jgi:diguanylate cyclase (GGDEF)-like protein
MIARLKSPSQDDGLVSAEEGARSEKLRRFQPTFSLVYWMIVLLVLVYAFSPLTRATDRPLLIGLSLVAATINLVFLHFLPHRFWNSFGVISMVVVTSGFTLVLIDSTGPLMSPFFAILLFIVLAASLVLSPLLAVVLVLAISLAFLGLVAFQGDLTPSSYLPAAVQLASLWVMVYVGGFLSQELSLTGADAGYGEHEQRIQNALQGTRDVFAGPTHSVKNALNETLERVTFALRVPAAGVFLIDEKKKGLILTSHSGLPSDLAELVAVQRLSEPGAGLASRAALQRKPVVVDDLITDPLVEEFREVILLSGWRSTACLPMISRGKIMGVLQLFADEMGFFTSARLAALTSLTTELGLSLENVALAEEDRRRRAELAALHGAAKTMSTSQTLKEAVQSAVDAIERLGFPRGKVLLLDEGRRELVLQPCSWVPPEQAASRVPLGKGLVGQAAQSGEVVKTREGTEPGSSDFDPTAQRSEIVVPLKVKGNLIGVLDIEHEHAEAFGEKDVRILTSFANQAAIAIDNARLYEAEKTRTEHLAAWRDYSARIQTAQSEAEVMAALLHYLDRLVAPSQSVVYRPIPEDRVLEVTQHVGLPGRCGDSTQIDAASCIAYRTGKAFRFDGASELPCPVKSDKEGGKSYLCLPMVVGGSAIGVMHLDSSQQPYWGVERTELARGFVDYAAPILQNVRYLRQLQQRAIQDELTGLYNRRFLEGHLHKQLAMASRYAQPLAVLMLDIDLFKTVNDRFGHDAGDRVLRSFSVSLAQTIRASDVVARWGGEEFVVVLPSTVGHAAKALAEKIRKSIEKLSFDEQVPGLEGITVSIGTAAYPDDGTTEDLLLKSADLALYRAKQGGRNRVEAAAV